MRARIPKVKIQKKNIYNLILKITQKTFTGIAKEVSFSFFFNKSLETTQEVQGLHYVIIWLANSMCEQA